MEPTTTTTAPTNPMNEMTDQELECLRRLMRAPFKIPSMWDVLTVDPGIHDEVFMSFKVSEVFMSFKVSTEFTVPQPRAILHGTTS